MNVFNLTSCSLVTPNSSKALKAAVAQQPVTIGINAEEWVWMFFKSGIFNMICLPKDNHAVTVVGYGK
jgi:cathepsin L